jgi:His-Xaa-Ser system radical SAM maturase HxsC
MISLRLKIDPLPIAEPLVVRLRESARDILDCDAVLIERSTGRREYDYQGFSLSVYAPEDEPMDGDVILMFPEQRTAHRLIRANSQHNTLLVTEQCDQLCVMCSQPPKKHHVDLFDHFSAAIRLAPPGAFIGLSGGEPLLHKERLWRFLSEAATTRPDLRFHILTNGQHFTLSDTDHLEAIGDRVLWGIPLYAASADLHDHIVGKRGAFEQLQRNLTVLAKSGSAIELRTVVMRQNWESLGGLARYVLTRLPFINSWSLMQLENIGYGRQNWDISFQDTSTDFGQLTAAINSATAAGIRTSLFNFPLCTVPAPYRRFAPSTISDWKRKYLPDCAKCTKRPDCGGFFEWYSQEKGFAEMGPL